ncbi:hypothetical protein J2R76_000381 [Bradyrhizobium sp. USDA 4532]|nr:hypothetical protein [Bradyrhizobium sp. USDA 4545]MCP1916790.1 hypothetical protein [Bradyrhizobium sp. USDA 4532]
MFSVGLLNRAVDVLTIAMVMVRQVFAIPSGRVLPGVLRGGTKFRAEAEKEGQMAGLEVPLI